MSAGLEAAAAPRQPARRWVSCADDYAIDAGAVDAIADLIGRGRVTATSALVDAPLWPAAARQLPAAGGAGPIADVGLHLNLTQAFAPRTAGIWPLAELLWRCATGLLPRAPLRAAITRQFDAFEARLGRPPEYVDGHQHVHQFAVVRQALLAEIARRYTNHRPWLRSTRPPPGIVERKARGIALLGDARLRAQAAASGLRTSGCLVGVYDFRAGSAAERAAYRRHMQRWLAAGPDGSVLMCHPASAAPPDDPIGAARAMEYRLLGSSEFGSALAEAGIALVTGTALFRDASA